MYKTKSMLEQLAEVEGGLSRSTLIRWLIRLAAREREIWPLDKQWRARRRVQEVQYGSG